MVLDRSTLAEADNQSFTNDQAGAASLSSEVQGLPNSDLVIITKPRPTVSNGASSTAATTINQALNRIGVAALPATVLTGSTPCTGTGQCSSFSAVGVPGLPAGQGYANAGLAAVPGASIAAGDLHGYFQENLTGSDFTYVSVERVSFDTGDPTADPAIITVGSDEPGSSFPKTTYTSANLGAQAGFFVVVLDAGSLAVQAQQTFANNNPGLTNMAALLAKWDNAPSALVIVRSIGAVTRVSSGTGQVGSWDAVAGDLQQLGSSVFYFDALNGAASSQYTQVGPAGSPGYPSPWTQIASAEHSGNGRLTGLLARDTSGQFYPDEATVLDPAHARTPLAGSLPGLISLPTSAWPDRNTPGDQNVLSCIAAHIDPLGALSLPIESNYTNQILVGNWAAWASTITDSGYYATLSGYAGCGSFTPADFTNVTAQLNREWTAVPAVWKLIGELETPLLDSQGNASEIQSIAAAVSEDIANGSQTTSYDGFAITSDMLWVLSTVPGFDAAADPLNFLAGALGLVSDLNQNSDGSNAQSQVTTTATNLASNLARQYTNDINGLDQVGDILVSDWTKLRDAAQNAQNLGDASGNWSWSGPQTKATNALLVATRRLAYTALFPLTYSLYRLSAGAASSSVNPQDVTSYQCAVFLQGRYTTSIYSWQPFANVPRYGGAAPAVSGENTVEQWVYARPNTSFLSTANATASVPTQTLLNLMFTIPAGDPYQTAPLFTPLQFALARHVPEHDRRYDQRDPRVQHDGWT